MNGTTIELTVVGGPAYNSKELEPGDTILKVDGQTATEANVKELLIGDDKPGSAVDIFLEKKNSKVKFTAFSRRISI